MMEIRLLPRKMFELVNDDGSIFASGKFGTWALARFGEKRKLPLAQITEAFGEGLQIKDMIDFILCAIEDRERFQGKPMTLTDVKLCEWTDDYDEVNGPMSAMTMLYQHASDKIDEKKSDPQPENQLSQ